MSLSRLVPLVLCVLSPLANAKGEKELITVLSARVRHELLQRPTMPDKPPGFELKNLQKGQAPSAEGQATEIEAATAENQRLSAAVADLKDELQQLKDVAATATCPVPPLSRQPSALGPVSLSLAPAPSLAMNDRLKVVFYVPKVCIKNCINCTRSSSTHENCGDGDGALSIEYSTEDPRPNIARAMRGKGYPCMVVQDESGTEWACAGEVFTLDSLHAKLATIPGLKRPVNHVAASGVGGSLRTGGRLRQGLDCFAKYVGLEETLSLRWDRSGLQSLNATKLMHGEPWTPMMVAGAMGHIELKTTSREIPGALQAFGFGYRTLDDWRFSFDADPLNITLPNAPPTAASSGAYGFVDPISIGFYVYDIYSFFSVLHQIMNPQIDVGLGGKVELSARMDGPDKLNVTFTERPSVHVAAWLKFDLEVQRVEVALNGTLGNIRTEFVPQPRNYFRVDRKDFPVDDSADYRAAASAPEDPVPSVEDDEQVPDPNFPRTYTASPRSGKWEAVRDAYFREHPYCEFKGCKCQGPFNVHHVRPFHDNPELELDPNNLITLCRGDVNHHLWCGHNGDFKDVNLYVRQDCERGHWPSKGLYMKERHDAKASKTTQVP